MNTYRPIQTEFGHWVVGWWRNGIWQGAVWGHLAEEAEAAFCAYDLSRMEWREAERKVAGQAWQA